MPNLNQFLKLNESILDPASDKLSPEIWDKNKKLKKSVKVHIIKILETWLKNYTNNKPKLLFLLGGMTGLQYTLTSDIDINFVIDVDTDTMKKMRGELPNGKLLPGTKHPVNFFGVQEEPDDWRRAGPIYDVLKDRWKKPPSTNQIKQGVIVENYRVVIEMARFFMAGLDSLITEFHSDVAAFNSYESYANGMKTDEDKKSLEELTKFKLQEIVSDIDGVRLAWHILHSLRKEAFEKEDFFQISTQIMHILHSLRKEAFEKEDFFQISTQIIIKDSANSSINNMVYKYIEKLGYQEKLKEILADKEKWLKKLGVNKVIKDEEVENEPK